jgi:hypothetical protein
VTFTKGRRVTRSALNGSSFQSSAAFQDLRDDRVQVLCWRRKGPDDNAHRMTSCHQQQDAEYDEAEMPTRCRRGGVAMGTRWGLQELDGGEIGRASCRERVSS